MTIKDLFRRRRNSNRQAVDTQANYLDGGAPKIKTGAIGLGDVFMYRLLPQLNRHGSFELHSVADVVPENGKMEYISRMVRKNHVQYYQIEPDRIPESFFDGLDVVYIASPNKFHLPHTLTSLRRGVFAVTEKPLVRNREELDALKRGAETYLSALFCQDHHIFKPITLYALDKVPELIADYGQIEHAEVTFLETGNLQGLERGRWLISPEAGGGIFIDIGTHMAAILTKVFRGEFADCDEPQLYNMYPEYVYPNLKHSLHCETGFYGRFSVQGEWFSPSESPNVTMRIAKGVGSSRKRSNLPGMPNNEAKIIEVNLESADLLLNYMPLGANSEYNGNRISKRPGSGLQYGGKDEIRHEVELGPGFYLIKDGVCTNLMNGIDERHEYLTLLDKIDDSLRSGSPFLDIYDAEKALRAVFMAYDKAGGVDNMRLENGYGDTKGLVYA